jgi:septal ring factor EnvC (AmiA/AmiB activator)
MDWRALLAIFSLTGTIATAVLGYGILKEKVSASERLNVKLETQINEHARDISQLKEYAATTRSDIGHIRSDVSDIKTMINRYLNGRPRRE